MSETAEFDSGKFMDREYYGVIGHYWGLAALHYAQKDQKAFYDDLHNIYGQLPRRVTKEMEKELDTLFLNIVNNRSERPFYDLWKIRRLLVSAMDENSMLFNRWERKQRKGTII